MEQNERQWNRNDQSALFIYIIIKNHTNQAEGTALCIKLFGLVNALHIHAKSYHI